MRTIIAGSRDIVDYAVVANAVATCGWVPSTVISGTARGVDRLGEEWAHRHAIPIERYPADWDRYLTRAGHIRNAQMARIAQALVAVWDGVSPGTRNMIAIARGYKLQVHVYRTDQHN